MVVAAVENKKVNKQEHLEKQSAASLVHKFLVWVGAYKGYWPQMERHHILGNRIDHREGRTDNQAHHRLDNHMNPFLHIWISFGTWQSWQISQVFVSLLIGVRGTSVSFCARKNSCTTNKKNMNDPLANKLMILYIHPRDIPSQRAIEIAKQFPEFLITDVSQVNSLPQWLKGVPTGAFIRERRVYEGSNLIAYLKSYEAEQKQQQQGFDETKAVPPSVGFAISDAAFRPISQQDSATVPTPTMSGANVGTFHSQMEDDPSYSSDAPVSESDLEAYRRRRNQPHIQTQQRAYPSNLEDASYVTM